MTQITNNNLRDRTTNWSPDGTKIAFTCDRGGDLDVCVVTLSNKSEVNLTATSQADDAIPIWHPSGQKIAFRSNRSGNNEIYVMNADGTNVQRLTQNSAEDLGPAWSPDGNQIAFSSTRDGNSEIYVMNADGSGQTRITNTPYNEDDIDWNFIKFATTPEEPGDPQLIRLTLVKMHCMFLHPGMTAILVRGHSLLKRLQRQTTLHQKEIL